MNRKKPPPDPLDSIRLKRKEVAHILGITEDTMIRHASLGHIPKPADRSGDTVREIIQWIGHLFKLVANRQIPTRERNPTRARTEEAEAGLKAEKLRAAKRENDLADGMLKPLDEYRSEVEAFCRAVKENAESLSDELCLKLGLDEKQAGIVAAARDAFLRKCSEAPRKFARVS